MAGLLPALSEAADAAAERCAAVSGGTEAEAFLSAVDEAVAAHMTAASALLAALRAQAGLASGSRSDFSAAAASADPAAAAAQVAGAVQLLAFAHSLGGGLNELDRSLRSRLNILVGPLSPMLPGRTPAPPAGDDGDGVAAGPQAAALRVGLLAGELAAARLSASPERCRRLSALLAAAAEPRFRALPRGLPRGGAAAAAARSLASDVVLARVAALLKNVSRLPAWAAASSAAAAAFELPVFSAYPADYMTAVGELLLALPQHLEHAAWSAPSLSPSAATDGDSSADGGVPESAGDAAGSAAAGEWLAEVRACSGRSHSLSFSYALGMRMPRGAVARHLWDRVAGSPATKSFCFTHFLQVCSGAAELVSRELLGVQLLRERGASQMAADLEYLINVLAALSVPAPPNLAVLAAASAAAAAGEEVADDRVGAAVAEMLRRAKET